MTLNEDKPIPRPYINGDVFLFPDGSLYKLTDVSKINVAAGNLTAETFKMYTEFVGRVNVSAAADNFSEATGRLVLDTDAYKGFIINMSDVNMETAARDINAPLTIISSQETGNGRIYFMGLKSIYAGSSDAQLDIYFDTRNNAYVIDSDKDILIDADVRVSASGDTNEYDDYSHVLTQ
jgi:phage baseplate assembly protein gpV